MTTKSPANVAHDAARAEDARRAHAELHAYIDRLERDLGTERLEHSATQRCLAECTRERDDAIARAEVAEDERDEARHLRDEAAKDALAAEHEAEERGARWALDVAREEVKWTGAERAIPKLDAARICAEARAKGGE